MKYLTPKDILAIHNEIINKTDGSHGIRDVGLLISLTERPKAIFGGKEFYKTVFKKAAVYLESLVKYHVFLDEQEGCHYSKRQILVFEWF